MKDVFYFPHEYNAHQDPKCSALIKDFGFAGYGIYWVMVEMLHEQGGKIKKFPKLFDGLAHQLHVEKDYIVKLIEALLQEYELLQQDQNCIWSERVLRNIEERERKKLLKVQAGRIGGLRSGASRARSNVKQCFEANEANEPKERKGNNKSNIHKHNNKPIKTKTVYSEGFEKIWASYPTPVGKEDAFRHYRNSVLSPQDGIDIWTALENYKKSKRVADGFIKDGSAWFNQWRDWVTINTTTDNDGIPLEWKTKNLIHK